MRRTSSSKTCAETVSNPLLDTTIYVHSLTNDAQREECRRFLRALFNDELSAELDIVVLHELTYSIPRYLKGTSKEDVVRMLVWLIDMPGIVCDKVLFRDALARWSEQPRLGFVDAYLGARAARDNVPVFTKNVRDLRSQGVEVSDPLPS
jgi:hypothetical protein